MKALDIGASGQVGKSLLTVLKREAWEILGTSHSRRIPGLLELDITNKGAVMELLEREKPDVVFLPAALTDVDYCEDHPDEAQAINVQGVVHVAETASRIGAKTVFFSTDYVFDGRAGPYGEGDETRPINIYGHTKLQAERYLRYLGPSHLIIRTAWVFGWDPDSVNFAMQLYRTLRSGDPREAAEDLWGNPTLVDYLAEVSVRLARENIAGTVHVAGKDHVSRFDFAKALARAFDLNPQLIVPAPMAKSERKALRPMRAGLTTERLTRIIGREAISLDEAMRLLREQWRNNRVEQ
jgi:dTDP-4-dehydrorhamnose reductase